MKEQFITYKQWLNEAQLLLDNEFKIIECAYNEFIYLPGKYNFVGDKKKEMLSTIKDIKEIGGEYASEGKHYHYLIALKKEKDIHGIFYKQVKGSTTNYCNGYMTGSGSCAKYLLQGMRMIGPFNTFSKISNFKSLASQIRSGAEILTLTDSTPDKENNNKFSPDFLNKELYKLFLDKQVYYKYGSEVCYFYTGTTLNEEGLIDFFKTYREVELVGPKKYKNEIKEVKLYLKFKKI
jgi:hypothetical protein